MCKKSYLARPERNFGSNACSTFLIVDAQSVKNTDTARHKGYDAGKKVSSIKRHIAVDTMGLPHAVALPSADVTDRAGALQALEHSKTHPGQVQSVLCDGGYTGEPFAQGVKDILGGHVTVQIAKRSELHTFKVMPKRWIVERSFAWLEKTDGYGKTANANPTPVYSSSILHFWHDSSKDHKQALRAWCGCARWGYRARRVRKR